VFYGWWNPVYVPLLVGSMVVNYLIGGYLMRRPSRAALVLGVAANVALLGYYKYTGFLFGSLDAAFGLGWSVGEIVLPLAISFFTFQQIAYLVDAHDGEVTEHDFVNYCLFISFFPQLIAGPITHHGEMLKQFNDSSTFRPRIDNISLGLTIFLLGLFKKVIIADPLGAKTAPIFSIASDGIVPAFYDAWLQTAAAARQDEPEHLRRAGPLSHGADHVHLRRLARCRLAVRGVRPAAWLLSGGGPRFPRVQGTQGPANGQ